MSFNIFQCDFGVTPDPAPRQVGGAVACPRALVTIPGSLKPMRDTETETGSLEAEKRVHRIHETAWWPPQGAAADILASHLAYYVACEVAQSAARSNAQYEAERFRKQLRRKNSAVEYGEA